MINLLLRWTVFLGVSKEHRDRWFDNEALRALLHFRFLYFFTPYAVVMVPAMALIVSKVSVSTAAAIAILAIAINAICTTVCEIPAGYIADKKGPGFTLTVGLLLMAMFLCGLTVLGCYNTWSGRPLPWDVLLAFQVAMGLPVALINGADSTFFRRVLERNSGTGEIREGLGTATKYVGVGVASAFGAVIFFGVSSLEHEITTNGILGGQWDPRVTTTVQLSLFGMAGLYQLRALSPLRRAIRETRKVYGQEKSEERKRQQSGVSAVGMFFDTVIKFWKQPELITWICILSACEALMMLLGFWLQPHLASNANDWVVGSPGYGIAYLLLVALMFFLLASMSALGSRGYQEIQDRERSEFGKIASAIMVFVATATVSILLWSHYHFGDDPGAAPLISIAVMIAVILFVRGFVQAFARTLILFYAMRHGLEKLENSLTSVHSALMRLLLLAMTARLLPTTRQALNGLGEGACVLFRGIQRGDWSGGWKQARQKLDETIHALDEKGNDPAVQDAMDLPDLVPEQSDVLELLRLLTTVVSGFLVLMLVCRVVSWMMVKTTTVGVVGNDKAALTRVEKTLAGLKNHRIGLRTVNIEVPDLDHSINQGVDGFLFICANGQMDPRTAAVVLYASVNNTPMALILTDGNGKPEEAHDPNQLWMREKDGKKRKNKLAAYFRWNTTIWLTDLRDKVTGMGK